MPVANAVLVDASALVALLDRLDTHHRKCVDVVSSITDPLVTVWPIVAETMYLTSASARAQEALLDLIDDGTLAIADLGQADIKRVKALMIKYRDLPMDFADAALVRVAERDKLSRIVTFDQHFGIYRLPGRARFVVLPALEER